MSIAQRVQFQTAMRAAAVELLKGYALDVGIRLQVYPARPASIAPPCAFVDRISERIDYLGPRTRQRHPVVTVYVVHGLFDSKEAADQKDAFIDGFLDWTLTRYHEAHPNSTLGTVATEDNPNYVPDWLPPVNGRQAVYYATLMQVEGLLLD